ncbi:Coronin-B [Toxocara canis]|uniref:Coronin-7 n=1 Tax=Toxocara canis TaxID=6265 RepID=A0A0B2V6F6_TOXCA|nr:Coronin-B [Toxocara canis]
MAWRFHPSKFKNTTPKTPKKEDTIFDVPVGTLSSGNNGIQCSSSLISFNLDGEGGKLGVLPVDARGRRQRKDMTIVCAHSEPLNDFTFFPFDANLLATCCRDERLKLWRIDNPLECRSIGDASAVLDLGADFYLECLAPHRTASQLLAAAYDSRVGIVDIAREAVALEMRVSSLDEHINSIAWSYDGKLLAALGDKGRHGAILDPRCNEPVADSLNVHGGSGRECRVIFAGIGKIVTSGFTNQRTQEIRLFDARNWRSAEHVQEYSPSTGVLLPLYDDDTKLLLLAGKGTNRLIITEIQSKAPVVSPVFEYVMHDQCVGACLGSKLRLDVMNGEVVRFYQLAKNCINPVSCIVPRRSYRDFHADLFPETVGPFPGCDSAEWLNGSDLQPMRVSLDPSRKGELIATVKVNRRPQQHEVNANIERKVSVETARDDSVEKATTAEEHANSNGNANLPSSSPEPPERQMVEETIIIDKPVVETKPEPTPEEPVRFRPVSEDANRDINRTGSRLSRVRSIVGVTSKYRHVETVPGGQHGTFTNVRSVNTRMPTESNAFCVSSKYAAIPLSGYAGIVSIVRLSEVCKLPDGVIDGVQNHTLLTDLIWNPFDESRLACGLDSGTVNVWTIEDTDRPLSQLEPSAVYKVSHDKIISIRYNPCALDVMAVAAQDHWLSVWNLESNKCEWSTNPHGRDSSLAIAWSSDGRKLASVGRDLTLSVYEPQCGDSENALINRKQVLESPRAARILFACRDTLIVLVHFTRSSARVVTLLDSETLETIHTHTVDTSSQPLVPYYDFDSSVLFLTGKGDRTITMFEVSHASPFLMPMAPASFPNGHQAISLHHKIVCDVRAVEFQRGWRLTEKSLERISFRVPRVKKDLFQSDLFPRALATWIPVMSASDWFAGHNQPPLFLDLCPEGMKQYISSPVPPVRRSLMQSEQEEQRRETAPPPPAHTQTIGDCRTEALRAAAREDRKLVEMSWSNRIGVDLTLEQDRMQGVDEEEWVDD